MGHLVGGLPTTKAAYNLTALQPVRLLTFALVNRCFKLAKKQKIKLFGSKTNLIQVLTLLSQRFQVSFLTFAWHTSGQS